MPVTGHTSAVRLLIWSWVILVRPGTGFVSGYHQLQIPSGAVHLCLRSVAFLSSAFNSSCSGVEERGVSVVLVQPQPWGVLGLRSGALSASLPLLPLAASFCLVAVAGLEQQSFLPHSQW